ncbi:MAG: toxin-antitoxin system HicB family antitoxin [Euryarchaeota archaeon]|nr:toxin-antitoxin system HicB family antitoxin [Euryarchaeota archaeon]MBT4981589.1 toxin-antitoxin system HicB family antitoxin [Euryarchaeota archaeon]MBT5183784.1 toxin-antitoxin system HicB family antitoxin [Euryarchaeota archaeon]
MEKKKILLRLDPKLHEDLRRWAEDDFRSLNAHIEFILKKSIRQNRRTDSSEE